MATPTRRTGIEAVGDVAWGTHLCQFYRSPGDLLETLIPYFAAGLADHEFCMWVTSEPLTARAVREAMSAAVPGFLDYQARGQIEIVPYDEWYLKDGHFDPRRVLDGWVEKLDQALSRGFAGLRLTGNTFWLEKKDWQRFTEYEAVVDSIIRKYRMLALCTYSLEKCGAGEVLDVMRNHEYALIKDGGRWELVEKAAQARSRDAVARLNEALTVRAAELEAANRELDAFAFQAAHDLRVPLGAIQGYVDLLRFVAPDLPDDGKEAVEGIARSSTRMNSLIEELLRLARTSEHELQVQPVVDTGALVAEVQAELAPQIAQHGTQLMRDALPVVAADAVLLRQVFQNLLANAVKYSRESKPPRVHVGYAREQAAHRFSVRDNGVGFDPAQVDRLFRAFQRLHGRQYEGIGMGLALVRRIVERHGGRVWAEGMPGQGATFYFTLPFTA